jgi:hypothetical protein
MDRRYIRDHQVIERYLKGTLTADEEHAFEELYLGDPDLLDEIELVERLGQGLKDVGATGGIERPRRSSWLSAPLSKQWAAAASLLVVVSLAVSGALYRENLSLRQQQPLTAGLTTRLLPIITVRGDPQTVLEAPSENDWVVLLVDPGFMPHDSYRAVLSRRSESGLTEIWSADRLTPEYQDQLAIGMRGSLLTPGEYELELLGRMNDWPAERSEPISQTAIRIEAAERR